ncbi:hypothetical protein BGZ91_008920 [Linnemannia elongata]|nr:hypothetical protein BGZ91_008920 [Linnemannia elongata]
MQHSERTSTCVGGHTSIFTSGVLGAPKDEAKALEWYTKAALQGEMHSKYNLELLYKTGRGTKQD